MLGMTGVLRAALAFAVIACTGPALVWAAPAPAASEPVRPIKRIVPSYPDEAYNLEISGSVRAELVVDDKGRVTDVKILSEEPKGYAFGDSAAEAFKRWRYPKGAPGIYRAKFNFAYEPPILLADEKGLPTASAPISLGRASYPDKALDAGMQGDVISVLLIEPNGDIARVRVMDDTAPGFGLDEEALQFHQTWRFAPANGRRIYITTLKFRIEGDRQVEVDDAVAVDRDTMKPAPERSRGRDVVYPYKARKAGISGHAEIAVHLTNGRVRYAGVLGESPTGHDFGMAAYKAVSEWRFSDAEDGAYVVRIEFTPEGDAVQRVQ